MRRTSTWPLPSRGTRACRTFHSSQQPIRSIIHYPAGKALAGRKRNFVQAQLATPASSVERTRSFSRSLRGRRAFIYRKTNDLLQEDPSVQRFPPPVAAVSSKG